MLQQTQVATVIPFYHSFLSSFPTLASLANADEQEVLRHWEGLGYYSRARNLHRAAKQILADHQGQFPTSEQVVRQLPGFGRYTTGAVLSQAFDARLPILEANSIRVLCRLFAVRGNPKSPSVQNHLWEIAETILPKKRVGDFNQALMELGALVCTVNSPQCSKCPLAKLCQANAQNLQEELPEKSPAPNWVDQQEVALVVWKKGEVFIARRPDQGRWAGLWEFPHSPVAAKDKHEEVAGNMLTGLTGLQAKVGKELLTVRHGVTRYRITLVCLQGRHLKGKFKSDFYREGLWVPPNRLQEFPFSSPQRKVSEFLVRTHQAQLF